MATRKDEEDGKLDIEEKRRPIKFVTATTEPEFEELLNRYEADDYALDSWDFVQGFGKFGAVFRNTRQPEESAKEVVAEEVDPVELIKEHEKITPKTSSKTIEEPSQVGKGEGSHLAPSPKKNATKKGQ